MREHSHILSKWQPTAPGTQNVHVEILGKKGYADGNRGSGGVDLQS